MQTAAIITTGEILEEIRRTIRAELAHPTHPIPTASTGSAVGKVYTFQETCKRLRVSAPTLRRMLFRGDVQGIRAGRNWRIPEASLQEYFQKTERE